MNRGGDGARRKRGASAGRPGSVGARISELEIALLARRQASPRQGSEPKAPAPAPVPEAPASADSLLAAASMAANIYNSGRTHARGPVAPRPSTPSGLARNAPSTARAGGLNGARHSLIEEAMAMCRDAVSNQSASFEGESSPRIPVARPNAPTPEQTNHWLRDLDEIDRPQRPEDGGRQERAASRSPSPDSPSHTSVGVLRPRSPTPTKMLAWEEARAGSEGDEDAEGRGNQTDSLISKLIGACQMNDIKKVFSIYEKLRRMRVQLYEGVYKLIIECCMRTQQLGHAMQFYETLKGSGQRISARLVMVLIEACAKEQHGDKVHAIWNDWCPPGEPISKGQSEVLIETVSALIRTMSPDLARDVLQDAMCRSQDALAHCLADAEVQLEELLLSNEAAADEARMNGMLMGDLAGQFDDLAALLESLRSRCLHDSAGQTMPMRGDALLMEDVDLDLELAAM